MNRGISKPRLLAAALVLTLAVAGCSAAPPASKSTTDPSTSSGPGSATSPPAPTATHRPSRRSPFASLRGYLARRAGVVTAAVYDRRSGKTWIYGPGIREDTASIVKVEIMATALHQAELAGREPPPTELAMIRIMIEHSDNVAATTLLAKVGGPPALRRFGLLAGLTGTTPSTLKLIPGTDLPGWGLTKTTAQDQVRLIKKFVYPSSLLTPRDRTYGVELMEHVVSDQAWGVSGGPGAFPAGTTVALKNGWLPHNLAKSSDWQVNSIGWVSGHGRDYVLAVLTNHSPEFSYGIETIETIARRMYAELGPGTGGGA